MAGTRLLINAIFVTEFFLLALLAVYLGLYRTKDPISHHLPQYQRGRSLLRAALLELEQETPSSLSLPSIQIVTSQELELVGAAKLPPGVSLTIHPDTATTCRQVATSIYHEEEHLSMGLPEGHNVVLCPSLEAKTHAMILRQGITFLYPNNPHRILALLEDVLQSSPATTTIATTTTATQPTLKFTKRQPLKLTLMMEHRLDWAEWANALSNWIQTKEEILLAWPCVNAMETQVVLSTLVEKETESKTATSNSAMRILSTVDTKRSVIDRLAPNVWNVVLYVPRTTPAFFDSSNNSSNVMLLGSTLIATIGQPETFTKEHTKTTTTTDEYGNPTTITDTTYEQVTVPRETLVAQAMAPLGEFFLQQCLGVTPTTSTGAISVDTDGSVPQWQIEAWTQRKLQETYQQVRTQVRQEGEWLLQSSTWVVIDESVAAHWQTLVEWMRQVVTLTKSAVIHNTYPTHLEALAILEEALDYLQVLRTEPTLMEPLRFSLPQFLAIFAPLCLPLFLPHSIGLIREWRRYKKLQTAKG